MKRNVRKASIAAGLSAAIIFGGAAASFAAVGPGRTWYYNLGGTGFAFGTSTSKANSPFYASSVNHGGMGYIGTLYDTNSGDGNRVKVQAKVEGYSYGGQVYTTSSVGVNQYVYDPAAIYVNYGNVQSCRDRTAPLADNCQATVQLNR